MRSIESGHLEKWTIYQCKAKRTKWKKHWRAQDFLKEKTLFYTQGHVFVLFNLQQ